jgi:predicted acyl esterase
MPVHGEPDWYVYDPLDIGDAELESDLDPTSVVDQRMVHARLGNRQLIYHSAPFERDTEVTGFFRLVAWLAIDCPDTDLSVSVHEIGLDGTSLLLTSDVLRARYRESLREARLIDTAEPLRYDFERFTFVSRRIAKGHRLRLIVGPINSIFRQKNYNSGRAVSDEQAEDARTVTVKLFHDPTHPTALYVPFGRV